MADEHMFMKTGIFLTPHNLRFNGAVSSSPLFRKVTEKRLSNKTASCNKSGGRCTHKAKFQTPGNAAIEVV